MAKKNKKQSEAQPMQNVEQTLSKTEQYLEENYKPLLKGLIIVVAIVSLIWLGTIYLNKRSQEAAGQMFQAEKYFEADSFSLALYGDGNYLGFIDIASSYKLTKTSNLARYYAGISFLHLGEFESAIEYLEKFRKRDLVLGATATGAIGDAWVELGDLEKGTKYYMEAANYSDNEFLTPIYLLKAGQVFESLSQYQKAEEAYTRIRENYPESSEAQEAVKHIARISLKN